MDNKNETFKKWILLLATFSKNSLSKVSAQFKDGEGHLWVVGVAAGHSHRSWASGTVYIMALPPQSITKPSSPHSHKVLWRQQSERSTGFHRKWSLEQAILTITPRVSATFHFARIQSLKGDYCPLAQGPVFRGSEIGRPGDPSSATDRSLGTAPAIWSEVHKHKTLEGRKDKQVWLASRKAWGIPNLCFALVCTTPLFIISSSFWM